jgi:tRNA threonylcarbamoyladenosine biosynthesis protein TsaE
VHDLDDSLSLPLPDESATAGLGQCLATALRPGLMVHLSGDLGSGKTSLVRAVLRALGYTGKVKSPTYTLVEPYAISNLNFYHFDLYRIKEPEEWQDAGFRDLMGGEAVCLVEWPEKAQELLPPPDVLIGLEFQGDGRLARITACTEKGRRCIKELGRCSGSRHR